MVIATAEGATTPTKNEAKSTGSSGTNEQHFGEIMSNRGHQTSIRAAACAAVWLFGIAATGGAAYAQSVGAPPAPGAIQRQLQPSQPLPLPPGQVLSLPQPSQLRSQSQVRILVRKIVIHGNTLLPPSRLQALSRPAEGRTMTLQQLEQVVENITQAYHKAGYPLAYAYLPQQRILNGSVSVQIVEARYGKITVGGHSKLKPSVALRTVGVAPGEMIAQGPLTRGLILLSQTPGVAAHAVFSPGERPQTSDMRLDVRDTPRLVGDVSVSNGGNKSVGSTLVAADGAFNDPFGYGSAVSANLMATPRGRARLSAGGLDLSSPYIWNGLRAGAYGSFTNYHLGEGFAPLSESGRADQAGVDATYPVLLAPGRSLVVRLDVLRNWLDQSSATLGTAEDEAITMERLSLGGSYADWHGDVTQGNLSLSHGYLRIAQPAAQATDALGPRTAGGFDVLALQLAHTQRLPDQLILQAGLSAQISDKNLDSSQKFYLGGPGGVIGYAVGDGGGDDGYLADVELSHRLPLPHLPGELRGGVLAQYGRIRVNHRDYPAYGARNDFTEAAIGPKMSYGWDGWSLIASYGWRIGSYARSGAAQSDIGEFWVSLGKSFHALGDSGGQ
jgi:hemolysin activation/secretion protein